MQITKIEYEGFQRAYDFFNAELFSGELPQVLITLQRKAKSYGHFCARRFWARDGESAAHELAMNPDGFIGRTDREILSTLVHEQCHVWQEEKGEPPRRCYHDKEWAAKMKAIGLYPSNTGAPGGKETGQKMTHYIIDGGAFDIALAKLIEDGFKLGWQSATDVDGGSSGKGGGKKTSKVKYTCPQCEANAWAKPKAKLVCGECYDTDKAIILMKPQDDGSGAEDEAAPEAA